MTDRTAFEELYAANPDPWRFATSRYEREKYRATLAVLGARRFHAGLEVGCSVGLMTRMLARRCARLLAVDIAEAALALARPRCRDLPQVRFLRAAVPDEWPAGTFDLIVLSEVLYFLSATEIAGVVRRVRGALRPGGRLVLVDWTGPTDTALGGREAARLLKARMGGLVRHVALRERPGYRLEMLRRRAPGR
jgi:SAM-dependent methyltransferase